MMQPLKGEMLQKDNINFDKKFYTVVKPELTNIGSLKLNCHIFHNLFWWWKYSYYRLLDKGT